MCHYITLVAATSDRLALDAVMRVHGRRANPIENLSLAAVLRREERQYLTTASLCDCGTVFARGIEKSNEEIERDRRKQVGRLANRGWTQAKIDRWFDDKDRANTRPGGGIDSVELWAAILLDLLGKMGLTAAGLFVHEYRGSIAIETLLPVRRDVRLGRDLRDQLISFREDELLMVQAK